MGMKYMVQALKYDRGPGPLYDACKQTRFMLVAVFWFVIFSIKYDGVDLQLRK